MLVAPLAPLYSEVLYRYQVASDFGMATLLYISFYVIIF